MLVLSFDDGIKNPEGKDGPIHHKGQGVCVGDAGQGAEGFDMGGVALAQVIVVVLGGTINREAIGGMDKDCMEYGGMEYVP